MTAAAILPGARVRAAGALIGAVERVEPPEGDRDVPGALLVRAGDGARYYRFPLALVAEVGEESEQSVAHAVVRLALDPAALARYAVRDDAGPGAPAPGAALRLPLAAEELVAETRPVRLGTVRLHKGVETAEQRLTVPVAREEVVVERIPADQYDAGAPADPDETLIPVVEERLVVETRAVVVAYVRVRKRRVTEEREVRAPVRREVVTVEELRAEGVAPPDRPLLHDAARREDTPT